MEVYLDNAATTKPRKEVVDAMNGCLTENYGNPSSLHSLGKQAKKLLEESRKTIAQSIRASPSEIVFTSGGTESNNLVLKGIAHAYSQRGKHLITSTIEHPSVLETCKSLEKIGFALTYLAVDREGRINLDAFEQNIKKETILVSIMHANNEIGTLQDIESIGKICKRRGVFFHTDAVQSFCKTELLASWCDAASLSAHKIHGPKGIGALYLKSGIRLYKQEHGGHQEKDMRGGTENVPGIVGFAKAVELWDDKDNITMTQLRDWCILELKDLFPNVIINGALGKGRLCNNISVSFPKKDGAQLLLALDKKGIAVSTGSACTAQSIEPSHVLSAIGQSKQLALGTLRISFSPDTTKKELGFLLKSLREILV